MNVKELIQKLRCFDKDHYVIVEITDDCISKNIETSIAEVKWDGQNCIIRTELNN